MIRFFEFLRNGCDGCLLRRSDGRSAETGKDTGYIYRTFYGKRCLGKKLGVEFPEDPVSYNLKVIDKLDPESTASMQKDLARGHDSEIQGLLFDMIAAAEEQGIDIPTYRMVAEKFKEYSYCPQ